GASALVGPGFSLSSAWRQILYDSVISRMRTLKRDQTSPSGSVGISKSYVSYPVYGFTLRRSKLTPLPRKHGPVRPQLIASSALITPMPTVLLWKRVFPVTSVSNVLNA